MLRHKTNKIVIFMFVMVCLFFTKINVQAYENNSLIGYETGMKATAIVDKNKIWAIRFNGEIKTDDFDKWIEVRDSNNNKINVNIELNDSKSIIIKPLSMGYTDGKYTICVNKNLTSKKGIKLKKESFFNFEVKSANDVKCSNTGTIKEIKVEEGLTSEDKYVEITLDTTTPENYTVKFGNETLKYRPSKKAFIGLVHISDEAVAKDISKYVVTLTESKTSNVSIKGIKMEKGISPEDRYVEITLDTMTPENYIVKFSNIKLTYDSNKKIFRGIIPTKYDGIAKDASKYTVTLK